MTTEPNVRYFLGANTPQGFYSLYSQLIDPASASAIYILKGGPGCGKSSLMKRVAEIMEEHGKTVEYIHCAGAPDSLDAILIDELGAALVDGTAPHVVEPQYPGAVERYVNLGACYDCAALGDIRAEIIDCMGGYKACYARAYRCLSAAAEIGQDMRELLLTPALEEKMAKRAKGILSREAGRKSGEIGQVSYRFLGGVTHLGALCWFETVECQCERVYEIADSYGLAHNMLIELLAGMTAAGHDVIACPSAMAPGRLEHLLIPALSLAFVTSSPSLPYQGRAYRRIRLDAMADAELLRHSRPRLRFAKKVSAALVEEAVDSLAQAKAMHDALEALYNPHVDFGQVYGMALEIADALLLH